MPPQYRWMKSSIILMTNFFNLVLAAAVPAAALTATVPSRLEQALTEVAPTVETVEVVQEETIEEEIVIEPTKAKIECIGCNENETTALTFFYNYGIKDKYALATLMGNIKQESNFHANICEGGARVNYENCWRGGYGLIQWTTTGRYDGLGRHARNIGKSASVIETQLSYLVTEREWKMAVNTFKTPGLSVGRYMGAAYTWLGWGIHGNRTYYANQYLNKIQING